MSHNRPPTPHSGGTLPELSSQGGTTIPPDSARPVTAPSHADPKSSRAFLANTTNVDLSAVADNAVAQPESVDDVGVAGEVTTGRGDQLPVDVEWKRLGGGGRRKGPDRHTKVGEAAGAAGRRGEKEGEVGWGSM
ncbi:hypothetical protein EX30DRAFT_364174 [Ascodesmis nigricans]|uniref:Uncharacterized protein n=1 Tax=Ascodesmis nigricans TaxID=341454 RepID=A0A4S2MW19_9PEZI|nr:hypothetical protein EX30DRAFT_364174 [Ascodesmis nigricans]